MLHTFISNEAFIYSYQQYLQNYERIQRRHELMSIFSISFVIFAFIIWLVPAIFLSKKAGDLGLSRAGHFCLIFFLHAVGLAVSLILMDNRKKELNRQVPPFYQQGGYPPYGQPPYGQPYQGQQGYNAPRYQCPQCGNIQPGSGCCMSCGAKMERVTFGQ